MYRPIFFCFSYLLEFFSTRLFDAFFLQLLKFCFFFSEILRFLLIIIFKDLSVYYFFLVFGFKEWKMLWLCVVAVFGRAKNDFRN